MSSQKALCGNFHAAQRFFLSDFTEEQGFSPSSTYIILVINFKKKTKYIRASPGKANHAYNEDQP
jgi:hypothetical protein